MNQYEDPYGPLGQDQFEDNPYRASAAEHSGARIADSETNQWAMILHLSQFAGFIVFFAGFLAPVIIWLVKKDDLPGLDAHGRNVVNWIISEFIYSLVIVVLVITVIGIPIAIIAGPILAVLGIAFPIIGAVKANDGIVWKYPGTISFL